jgi:DNA modification methylase
MSMTHSIRAQQHSLFQVKLIDGERGVFTDPVMSDNKSLPVHRWVPWIAGYSASFVDDVISKYLSRRQSGVVLDPFCGVGTTLLQAARHGYDALGFEINPYPALAARVKLNAADINLTELDEALANLQSAAAHWKTIPPPLDVITPSFKSRLPFFSATIHSQALHLLAFIKAIDATHIADLFRVAFGAVMVSFSNYSYEPSLTSRPAAGKSLIEDADVGQIMLAKLSQMRADIALLQGEAGLRTFGASRVVNADFFNADDEMETGTVNLMVTSPPYLNNYHYVRNTRPHLYWLDFISTPSEQKRLETNNFGQYWQTVRDAEAISLDFKHRELEQILRRLRETRVEKGSYGGPGWANYVASYFNDCFRFMAKLKRALARGGVGVIVIGNSIIQGIDIRTEKILGEVGAAQGLLLEGIHCIREKRVGASITQSSVRQGDRSQAVLSEFAVVVKNR